MGARVERFETDTTAAPVEGANAVITSLHYHQRLGNRTTSRTWMPTTLCARPPEFSTAITCTPCARAGVRYQFTHGKHIVTDNAWGGVIAGRAPLSDRFVLGNSYYLRGWNKYEIDPLGGNRAVYNSVEYHYGPFQASMTPVQFGTRANLSLRGIR